MTNLELLMKKIDESGMTKKAIALKSGFSRETFYNRLNDPDFKASEIVALTETLRLTKKERDAIFFATNSELKSTSEESEVL